MEYTKESAVETLLKSYQAYYNITKYDGQRGPLVALCEFYESSERFVISQKAKLWSAECEEFIYLYETDHLTKDLFLQIKEEAYTEGMKMAHIGPGHMYTYITPVIVCNSADEEARKAVKKCRIYKSFHFSLHGWMDYHAAVLEVTDNRITTNGSGRCVKKVMDNVLFSKKRR